MKYSSVPLRSKLHLHDAKSISPKLIENNFQLKLRGEIINWKSHFSLDGFVPFTYLQSFSDRWCCGCLCPIWFEPKLPPNFFWHLLSGAKFTLPDWNNCVEGMTLRRRMWAKPSRRVRKSEKIKTFSEDVQDFGTGWHTSEYQPCHETLRTYACRQIKKITCMYKINLGVRTHNYKTRRFIFDIRLVDKFRFQVLLLNKTRELNDLETLTR